MPQIPIKGKIQGRPLNRVRLDTDTYRLNSEHQQ